MSRRTPVRKPIPGNARSAAYEVLIRVYEQGAYGTIALDANLPGMDMESRDRGFASALLYGTLSRTITLDHVIRQVSNRPLSRLDPAVRTILRMGVWQILFSDSIPDRAACNESVLLARHYANPGAAGMVNGVLRSIAKERPDVDAMPFALRHALPEWIADGLSEWVGGTRADQVAAACNRRPELTIRANRTRTTVRNLASRLAEEGVGSKPGAFHPDALRIDLAGHPLVSLKTFEEGLFMVQDEAAMLVSTLLAPRSGERVADYCAAPGGKTCHIAELTGDQAWILAGDLHPSRLGLIVQNTDRLRLKSIHPMELDVTRLETGLDLFDRVLCDVPCSGLGLLAKKPEIRLRLRPEEIAPLAAVQKSILDQAAQTVRPGGVLLYSTCTLHPDENERQADAFLERHAHSFEPAGFTGLLPEKLKGMDPVLTSDADRGRLHLYPGVHDCDGFYIARFRRVK